MVPVLRKMPGAFLLLWEAEAAAESRHLLPVATRDAAARNSLRISDLTGILSCSDQWSSCTEAPGQLKTMSLC